jgi:hypothetical protein
LPGYYRIEVPTIQTWNHFILIFRGKIVV